jgi:hypothetical protein
MELFLLGGGASAAAALVVGLAFARSLIGISLLLALGAFAVALVHAVGPPNELLQASANANFLGWAAGSLVVARTRAMEWLDLHAQEAA